jgi:hypothetical protein
MCHCRNRTGRRGSCELSCIKWRVLKLKNLHFNFANDGHRHHRSGNIKDSFHGCHTKSSFDKHGCNGLVSSCHTHLSGTESVECLRDIGLENHLRKIGGETLPYTRFAQSMVGEEFARVYAWGNGPNANVLILYSSSSHR